MKIWVVLPLMCTGLLLACKPTVPVITPTPEIPTNFPASPSVIPPATQAPIQTLLSTQSKGQSTADYCMQIQSTYQPAQGFQTYCDKDYGFAFDYPLGWDITWVGGSSDNPLSSPAYVRKSQRFGIPDLSNYIRVDTYRAAGSLTFSERVENSIFYIDRAYPDKDYPTLRLGGKAAYAILNCWQQDYSSVMLFFQHGQYYSIMELKAITRGGLDTNWQIARSLQTPGAPADKNVIPQELIDDSYQLFTCNAPPTAQPIPWATPTPTPTVPPEGQLTLERVAQSGGSINGIAIVGNVAYIGMGPRVAAIDLSDAENPKLIRQSEPLPGLVNELLAITTTKPAHLLVGTGKYLAVLNTSSLTGLVVLHQLALPGTVTSMALDEANGMLYAAGSAYHSPDQSSTYIASIDVAAQDGPKLLDSINFPESITSMATAPGSIFIGTYSSLAGLYRIALDASGKLSTPRVIIPSTENPLAFYSLQVIGKRLYAGVNMEMQAYDVTDPDQPTRVWSKFIGFTAYGFSLDSAQMDIFGWPGAGAYIPAQITLTPPEPVSGEPFGQVASLVAVHKGYFLVAYHDLEVYTSPELKLRSVFQSPVSFVLGMAADERAVYVVDAGPVNSRDYATLRLLSLPDLEPLGQVQTEIESSCCWFSGIAVEGERAYLAGVDGLWVYDTSSYTPTLTAKPDFVEGQLVSIAATQLNGRRLLFTAEDNNGVSALTTYDMTDPQTPAMIGSTLKLERGMIHQMTWNGSYLYAVLSYVDEGDSDRLFVVSFRDNSLQLLSTLSLPGSIYSFSVDGNSVVLAGTQGLSLVSITDPSSPKLFDQLTLPGIGSWVALVGNQLVVVAGDYFGTAQLLVYDLSDPANPRQTKALDLAFGMGLISSHPVSEPYLVLANGASGVDTLDYTLPSVGLYLCLDTQAKPQSVPAPPQPLEVRFISDGNIWLWEEGSTARQVSETEDVLRFTISPDGQVIAFERRAGDYPYGQFKIELWAVNRDGGNLRRLVSADQFDQLLPGRPEAWVANVPTDYRWFSGTHELTFGVYPWVNAVGAGNNAEGYWVVDADNLVMTRWEHPVAIDHYGPREIPSPDSRRIAVVDRESIGLRNADGSVIRENAITYPANNNAEGPGWGAPQVVWAPDSQSVRAVVWVENDLTSFSSWVIPVDGNPAIKLHTFSGMEYFSSISPNQEYIAYLRRPRQNTNFNEMHLAKFDGSADIIYAEDDELYFQGWALDSYHFVYDLFPTHQPRLGSLCGAPTGLVAASETPATQITWVDSEHFLFVSGEEGQTRQLRLGEVGGESLLVGSFEGPDAYYQVRQEGQDEITP